MPDLDDAVSYCLVLTTFDNREDAESLVTRLVHDRLVACGTIVGNALSIYEWQGTVEQAAEFLVLLKTRSLHWDGIEAVVRELHPYDVPELLTIPIDKGLPAYLAWLAHQTTQESK